MPYGKKINKHSIIQSVWFVGIFFSLNLNFIYADWDCYSNIVHQDQESISHTSRELEKAVIRAKVWKIHREDGVFEMTENAIENGLEKLVNSFKEYGILVNFLEPENIYSDSLYYFAYNGRPFELMQSHSVDSLINFYYLPNINYTDGTITGYGQAFNTPGNELFVAGNECKYISNQLVCYDLADTFIPIHELGHCLSLLHTHSTANGSEHVIRTMQDSSCSMNCNYSGDLLCDTDASLSIKNDVIYNGVDCTYIPIETDECGYIYEPQVENFMSYTHFECGTAFTQEQVSQMFSTLENHNILSQTVINLGDINDDSVINILDILIIVNAILSDNSMSDLYLWLGDFNNDFIVDIIDIILLVNTIMDI